MAEMMFKKGLFRILSDNVGLLSAEEANELIKIAGTTCYQTRETSKKSAPEFVDMLLKVGHYAMLEHSWRTVEMSFDESPLFSSTEKAKALAGWRLFKANNLFCITERPSALLISGNARIFNEAYAKRADEYTSALLFLLNKENSALFRAPAPGIYPERNFTLNLSPRLIDEKEKLVHRAMTVEFNNHSRGMTHETVRSRNGDEKITSYAQESTRWVDYDRGVLDLDVFQIKFVLPYRDGFDFGQSIEFSVDGIDYSFTPQRFANLIEGWYRALRKDGLKPEEARQWLPIGLKAQIVQTYNFNEWRHWFFLRAGPRAHPEIRYSAVRLLQEMQQRTRQCFNDFEISSDGESAVYKGKDSLV